MTDSNPNNAQQAPGSFRDPQGRVFEFGDRVFRALDAPLAPFPHTWSDTGPLAEFVAARKFLESRPLASTEVPPEVRAAAPGAAGFLEHPPLVITFPFEWPFELLKRAALLHLELHRALLRRDLTLSDGFAFNVQFAGTRPIFIDALAVVPYVEGQPWAGYAQFCDSFLNPLLLASRGCETWQDSYRGRLRGIPTREVARQLGAWGAWRAGAFVHVILNSQAEQRAVSRPADRNASRFSRAGLDLMLASLMRCIDRLALPKATTANWGGYEGDNSYTEKQREKKHAAVREFVGRVRPGVVLDLGCNAGEYSETALEAGASMVFGLERDSQAVDRAVARADRLSKPFLPLQGDIQNLSPAQGWQLAERRSFTERVKPDAVLCLALIHHLVLGEGVPLERVLRAVVALAPSGIVEFVPRDDPMSRKISGPPDRLTHAYDLPTFLMVLSKLARVVAQVPVTNEGRMLVEYRRES